MLPLVLCEWKVYANREKEKKNCLEEIKTTMRKYVDITNENN